MNTKEFLAMDQVWRLMNGIPKGRVLALEICLFSRLDFRLDMEYTLFKKAKVFFQETYESYQNVVFFLTFYI